MARLSLSQDLCLGPFQFTLRNIGVFLGYRPEGIIGKTTSNNANAKVEENDGAPKRSSDHRNPTHQSTQHDYGPASVVIDQHTADRPCKDTKHTAQNYCL